MTADSPTETHARLPTIDVLRGIAVLGILVMNIQSFAMPEIAYINPYAWGGLSGANGWVYRLSHVFASGKFISIFAMLFGAGIAIQASRGQTAGAHCRRMVVLLVIGLLHAYLLWYGDILVSYALLGCVAFLFRRLGAFALTVWAAAVYGLGFIVTAGLGGLLLLAPPDVRDDVRADFSPTQAQVSAEIATYRSSWPEQMPARAESAIAGQTIVFALYTAPFAGGMMLLGMALAKARFFEAAWPRSRYVLVAAIGCGIGWPIAALQLWLDAHTDYDPLLTVMLWRAVNVLAMPLVAIGYAAIVVLLIGRGLTAWPLAAVGRTALSCYLLETIICTTIFYGHGLGWFGSVDRVGQMGVVVGVWIVLLIAAPLWLRAFEQGPMEWLWRRLAYGSNSRR